MDARRGLEAGDSLTERSLVLVVRMEGMTSMVWICKLEVPVPHPVRDFQQVFTHVSVCFGLYRQLGMLGCWNEMKRMTGKVMYSRKRGVFLLVAQWPGCQSGKRRRETWRRNVQRWEENQP